MLWSFQARDQKLAEDVNGARRYGSTARCLNIWATVLGSIMILIIIILTVVLAVEENEKKTTITNMITIIIPGLVA